MHSYLNPRATTTFQIASRLSRSGLLRLYSQPSAGRVCARRTVSEESGSGAFGNRPFEMKPIMRDAWIMFTTIQSSTHMSRPLRNGGIRRLTVTSGLVFTRWRGVAMALSTWTPANGIDPAFCGGTARVPPYVGCGKAKFSTSNSFVSMLNLVPIFESIHLAKRTLFLSLRLVPRRRAWIARPFRRFPYCCLSKTHKLRWALYYLPLSLFFYGYGAER